MFHTSLTLHISQVKIPAAEHQIIIDAGNDAQHMYLKVRKDTTGKQIIGMVCARLNLKPRLYKLTLREIIPFESWRILIYS